jgi:hypothetical protein
MKLAVYQIPQSARLPESPLLRLPGASSIQFGNEVLVYASQAQWKRVLEQAARGGADLREQPRSAEKQHLHLVVQNGRLFQQAHPDVPVILDKGRFLLVELAPEQARTLDAAGLPCYSVRPLERELAAFQVRARGRARAAPIRWVQDLVDRVSSANFKADLGHLVQFRTRFSTSSQYTRASTWARGQLAGLGYTVRYQNIRVGSRASRNVIADRSGRGPGARDLVVVGAHLDSINLGGGASASAPGADDNGSGSAGLLEMARAFRQHRGVHDLRFVLFGGEEQGLHGSKQYVSSLAASERARMRAVVNMDMIAALNTPAPTVLLEGAAASQAVIDGLADAAAAYTSLVVQTSLRPFNSDHVPFIEAGIPAVLTIEGADGANENIHSAKDTLDLIDDALAVQILRMNTAFVANAVGSAAQS